MYKQFKSFISILILLCSLSVFSQNFVATVSKNTVEVGERFQLTYTITTKAKNFIAPPLTDFRVLGGPNQGSSYRSVNGKTTSQITVSYVLTPTKEGKFIIAPADLVTNSGQLKTKAITITVKKLSEVEKRNIYRQYLFLKASVSRTHLFQGEQLTATYKLYTKVAIQQHELTKLPELTGFWNRPIEEQTQATTEVLNGQRWTVHLLKKVILIPQRNGDLLIDPFKMKLAIVKPGSRRSVFSPGELIELNLSSRAIKIKVKPLPKNAPISFKGAVGEFRLASSINKTEAQANESIDYKMKISGKGNFHLFGKLEPKFPEDFEVYDPKITNRYKVRASGTKGAKEWSYLVIPRFGGDFTVPPVEFSYFSPKQKKYITLKTEAYALKVSKGTGEQNVTFNNRVNKKEVTELDSTIRYIHTESDDLTSTTWFGSWLHYLLLLLAPLLVGAGLFYKKQLANEKKDTIGTKKKKANKTASKYLAEARGNLANKSVFYDALSKALYGYLSDKLSIPLGELSKDKIKEKLSEQLDEIDLDKLIDTLHYCEMAKYAPSSSVSEEELLNKAEEVINQIEEKI